jgi:nucleoside-diphosphate-sugar epimerase
MRVLVTGATGFVGSALISLLGQHEVACIGRKRPEKISRNINWINGDLLDLEDATQISIRRFSPECCVHLAWAGLPNYSPEKCLANLTAGVNLFNLLHELGCRRIIGAGTCWEYGERTGEVTESIAGFGQNPFAAHKSALREIGQSLMQGPDNCFIWARIFFVYGAGQRSTSLIPSVYRAMKMGDAPKISTPNALNDFVHVQDVAGALLRLIENCDASGIYNVGSGQPTSVAEVVNEIANLMGLDWPYPTQRLDLNDGFWADIERLKSLGWTPSHTLQSGVAQVISALESSHAN